MTRRLTDALPGITDDKAREMLDQALALDAGVPYVHHSLREMKERDLSRRVRHMVDDRQLWGYSSYDYQRRSGSGWVDWVIIGPGGVLFRELKSRNGSLSPQQKYVGEMLRYYGHDWALWDPDDLTDGTIGRQLDALMSAASG